jgi:hypothetical protein
MALYVSFYINTNTATIPNMTIHFNGSYASRLCLTHRAAAVAFASLS